jgi:exopolysaccharide biosynthesis polyprenyl glycosylphosphotransferase
MIGQTPTDESVRRSQRRHLLTRGRLAVSTEEATAEAELTAAPGLALAPEPLELDAAAAARLGQDVEVPILRWVLYLLDAIAVGVAWFAAVQPWWGPQIVHGSPPRLAAEVAIVVGATICAIGVQRLYLARVCGVRAVEIARLGRAAAFSAIAAYLAERALGLSIPGSRLALGAAVSFVLLANFRSGFDWWLKTSRTQGHFSRPVLIVGANEEGVELYRLLHTHPELGFNVLGVVGRPEEAQRWSNGVPWLGEVDSTVAALRAADATGVIIAASAVPPVELNRLVRELTPAGVHVHLSSGLRGIAHRRLRSLPLAYEPLFYLEPLGLARWQLAVKRTMDVVIASTVLVLTSPLLVAAAVAIKLQDRGPVLFRQERIGFRGRPLRVLKLRTMVPDAEQRRGEVTNDRDGGPLFKAASDPRRTRVGRLLEATSMDELPQLINVLRGEMSLVGPRPALPSEVAQFDDELLERLSVAPGITGLWQVEARDNPAFHAYRRLDLFYVENWSVTLDFAILLGTVRSLVFRSLQRS